MTDERQESQWLPGPLSRRLVDLCRDIGPRLGVDTRAQVDHVHRRLNEPLRVALKGRYMGGKSTIINALIGRRIARSGRPGESTRVDAQFRHGTADQCDVVRRDGSRVTVPLDDAGIIPARLGVHRHEIAYLDVTVAGDVLRDLTLVNTPRLGNAPARFGEVTNSEQAVMFVFTQRLYADHVETFRSMAASVSSSPVSSFAILNKVDKLVAGSGDPWPLAQPLAEEQAHLLWQVASDVVPVVALLAETTGADALTAADHDALRRLATLPEMERVVLLASRDLFTTRETVVTRAARERLLDLLDLYGVALAVGTYVRQPQLAPGEIVQVLRSASGWPRLRQAIDRVFRRRADAIKAHWALSSMEGIGSLAGNPVDRELIRDAVVAGLRSPELQRLRWLTTTATMTGDERPPDELVEQIRQAYVAEPGQATDRHFQTVADEFARWRKRRSG